MRFNASNNRKMMMIKKFWKKKEQSRASVTRLLQPAAESHPYTNVFTTSLLFRLCHILARPITAAPQQPSAPILQRPLLASASSDLPPCRRCSQTSGLRGLPRSARAAPPFKCRPHQCRRHLLPHFLGSTTSLALHHPHHIRWPLNHSYVTTRAHFLKRPLPPLAIPHSRSELKNGRGMFFSRFKSFTHSRC